MINKIKKNKKVCIVVRDQYAPNIRAFNDAQTLKDAGYDVCVLGIKKDKNVKPYEIIDDIPVYRVPVPKDYFTIYYISPEYYLKTVPKLVRKAVELDADIYHCHDIGTLPVLVVLKKFCRKTVVYEAHDPDFVSLALKNEKNKNFKFIAGKLIYMLERYTSIFANITIVTTPAAKDNRKYLDNVKIIYYRANPKHFNPNVKDDSLKNKYEGNRLLCYTGRIDETKGFVVMLEVMKKIKKKISNVKWLIVGKVLTYNGLRINYERTLEIIKEQGLEDNIEVIPWVPYWDVAKYINISEIGVVPIQPVKNYVMGLQNKLLDYMSCGIPVVACDFPEERNIIKKADCGILVDATNPEQLAEAIIYLLKNPKRAKEMGQNGLKAVREIFIYKHEMEKLVDLYEKLY